MASRYFPKGAELDHPGCIEGNICARPAELDPLVEMLRKEARERTSMMLMEMLREESSPADPDVAGK